MKRFLVIVLLPLVFFGCSTSHILERNEIKPLQSPISCRENERIIVQVREVQWNPSDIKATEMTSPGSTTPIAMPYGWIYINTPPTFETKDYGPEFDRTIAHAFANINFQELVLSLIKENLNSKLSCAMVYLAMDDLKRFSLLPSDKVIRISIFWYYNNDRPVLRASMQWGLITNPANIPIIDILMKEGYDAYGVISYKSPAHSRNTWLKENGKMAREETNKALDELARQLAIVLFPGEKDKEGVSTTQRISSPQVATPQTALSAPPKPQEPIEKGQGERGIISITTDPPGAKVFIDGEFKGQTPAEISLTTGTYQIFLQRQLYGPYKEAVTIEKSQTKTLNIKLSPEEKEQK